MCSEILPAPSQGTVTFDCPLPPSVNNIWRHRRLSNGKLIVYPSVTYQKWKREAGWEWTRQRPKNFRQIHGHFQAIVTIAPFHKRKLDLDNRIKGLFDLLQAVGAIADDANCRRYTHQWGEREDAPMGCRILIQPI